MTPLISVFFPTRKRTQILQKSLQSLLERARYPEQIEICLAFDQDDTESQDYFRSDRWRDFVANHRCQAHTFETQRWGYKALHQYLNFLAPITQGQWLFFWGDDAIMETQHWDDHVRANQDFVGLLHITTSNFPMQCSILPLFHRSWLDLFGCVSPVNPADSWISAVAKMAGARRAIPVTVIHDRFEHTGNNQDETWQDKQQSSGWNRDYHTVESQLAREQWAMKLQDYRRSISSSTQR